MYNNGQRMTGIYKSGIQFFYVPKREAIIPKKGYDPTTHTKLFVLIFFFWLVDERKRK